MPLANELRPESLDDFVGQEQVIGKSGWLRRSIQNDQLSSMIFFGPPGTGKTTLAHIISNTTKSKFIPINAVLGTVKLLKVELEEAIKNKAEGNKTIIFVDEIHRFNKAQQDVLLPYVERGDITLIGATTENPSFTVISPLISRSKVLVFNRLENEDLAKIIERLKNKFPRVKIDPEAEKILIEASNGDARLLMNAFEDLSANYSSISKKSIEKSNLLKVLKYDRNGEEHYNIISALHKSMRDSDPNASVYWMMRMIEAGEDPLYIARRLIRFAAEDIGLADPHALLVANSAYDSCHYIGLPECDVILAETVIYLSVAPKSNACYKAVLESRADIRKFGNLDVPKNIRNASTKLMKEWGYGKGYKYAHDFEDAKVDQVHLPEELKNKKYYQPTDRGIEARIKNKLDKD
jgi:putative ATPase